MESAIEYRTALIDRKTTTSKSVVFQLGFVFFSLTVALAALSIGLFCLSRDQDKALQLSELQSRIVQLEDELSGIRRAVQLLRNEFRSTAVDNVDVVHWLLRTDGNMAPPSKDDESEEMHYGASNRVPGEGDDGKTEQYRVKRSSNHRVNNNKNNNNKNIEQVTQGQLPLASKQQSKNAASTTPTKPPKPKRPRNPATPAKSSSLDPVMHFDSTALQSHEYARGRKFAVDHDTIIKGWRPAAWMSNTSSTAFHQHGHGASVDVTEPGLYLLYAQVSYLTNADQNGFSIVVKANSQHSSPSQVLARCIVGVDYLTAGGDTFRARTCQTTTVVHLATGQRVQLRDASHADQVYYLNDTGYNYWGLVRLSAPPS